MLTVFKREIEVENYFKKLTASYEVELRTYLDFVSERILEKGVFCDFEINYQIEVVALYYRLSKIILQLTALVDKHNLKN